MIRGLALLVVVSYTTLGLTQAGPSAQNGSATSQLTADARTVAKRLVKDQLRIFESPVQIAHPPSNARYVIPLVIAGALIPVDRHIEPGPSAGGQNTASRISDVGLYGTAGTIGGLYLYGVFKHDDRAHEAGELGAESLADSFVPYALTNLIAGRLRPTEGNGHGDFFAHHALSTSFPSGHATFTWSMASVLAHEYRSPRSQVFWYTVGGTVAATRVLARKHFTSDVIVGSSIGWLIGRYVFRAHTALPQ